MHNWYPLPLKVLNAFAKHIPIESVTLIYRMNIYEQNSIGQRKTVVLVWPTKGFKAGNERNLGEPEECHRDPSRLLL